MISFPSAFLTCEAGAAGERLANLYEAVKGEGGGGLTGNSLSNIKWVTCVFLFKTEVRGRDTLRVSVQVQVAPGGPRTFTRLAVRWRCKREGQRPLAKDTSSDNPFCAVCCFHLPGRPTKIRLLHLKQNSWNLLRVE